MASSSNSPPCAACKFLRRKCQPECVFAPYFPPDQPHRFANVHKVFGASNVTKLLNDLLPHQREDAVNSLAYEADMRIRDPVYGCVGVISLLQHQLQQLHMDLTFAKSQLSKFQNVVVTNHDLIASSHHQNNPNSGLGIHFVDGVSGNQDQFYHHHQCCGDQNPATSIHNFGLGNNYDPGSRINIAMNVSHNHIGQSGKFRATADLESPNCGKIS